MAGVINAVTITNDSAERTEVNHAALPYKNGRKKASLAV